MSGPKNKLTDLNNLLFEQLERLNDTDYEGEKLKEEIARAKAITSVAGQVISNADLILEGQKLIGNSLNADIELPRMLDAK